MTLSSIVTTLKGLPRKKKKVRKKSLKQGMKNLTVSLGVEVPMKQATDIMFKNEAQYTGVAQYKPTFFTLVRGSEIVGVIGVANPRGRNTLAWMNLHGKQQGNAGEIVLLNVDERYKEDVSNAMEGILSDLAQKQSLQAIVWLPLLDTTPTTLLTYNMNYYGESSPRSDFYKVVGDDGEYKRNPQGKTEGVAGVWLPRLPLYRFANIYTVGHQPNKEAYKISNKRPLTTSEEGLNALRNYKETLSPLVFDKRTQRYYTNPRTTGSLKLVKDVYIAKHDSQGVNGEDD